MTWAPDYCLVEDLKGFINIPVNDSVDDVQLALAIAAASRAIDKATGRQFGLVAAPEARFYTARYEAHRDRWVAEIDDLMTTTGLLVAFDSDADETYVDPITVYALRPVNAAAKGRAWTDIVVPSRSAVSPNDLDAGLRVTARWGWTAVPPAVEEACLLQASRLFSRRNSPHGVTGSPEAGGELRLLAKVDPDVEVALADYRRHRPRVVFA